MLVFDPIAHTYTADGARLPSVTQVIASALGNAFANVPDHVLEHKRRIGEATHLACHLDDLGDLDEASVHPEVLPRLEAWRAFRDETGFEVLLSEQPLSHPLGYAGMPDRYGLLAGARANVDLKTGLPGLRAGLQTAAYAALIDHELGADDVPMRRFALHALPNGRYRMTEYTRPGDWRDFLACLAVHNLKEKLAHG